MYLGKLYKKDVPKYASPARETDYSNLPPAYTFVGDIEAFYEETLTYIDNLKKAGIEAKVDVYKNWFHTYDMFFLFKKITKRAVSKFEKEFLYDKENYFAKQNSD